MSDFQIITGDAISSLRTLADNSVQTCVTSPPYWGLRDYGHEGQIGLEKQVDEYVRNLVQVFTEVKRVLRDDGTLWLNIGDSYHKKQLMLIPARIALALQQAGWVLRSDIIWNKPNPMPDARGDRPGNAHEHIFLFGASRSYYYDAEAVKQDAKPDTVARYKRAVSSTHKHAKDGTGLGVHTMHKGRKNDPTRKVSDKAHLRNVWTVNVSKTKAAHFAAYPVALIEPCIKAGSRKGDTVLDPFLGSGTTAIAALSLGRKVVGIELNPEYVKIATERITSAGPF